MLRPESSLGPGEGLRTLRADFQHSPAHVALSKTFALRYILPALAGSAEEDIAWYLI